MSKGLSVCESYVNDHRSYAAEGSRRGASNNPERLVRSRLLKVRSRCRAALRTPIERFSMSGECHGFTCMYEPTGLNRRRRSGAPRRLTLRSRGLGVPSVRWEPLCVWTAGVWRKPPSNVDILTWERSRWGEMLVVRGELRAGAGRYEEAIEDFDRALALAGKSQKERALYGRLSCRASGGCRRSVSRAAGLSFDVSRRAPRRRAPAERAGPVSAGAPASRRWRPAVAILGAWFAGQAACGRHFLNVGAQHSPDAGSAMSLVGDAAGDVDSGAGDADSGEGAADSGAANA